MLMTVTSKDPRMATPIPETEKPSKNEAVNQNKNPFITNINKPNESNVMGRVKKTNKGFTNKFNNPRINAAIRAAYSPSTSTPGTSLATSNSARDVTKTRAISFIKNSIRVNRRQVNSRV